MGDLRVETPNEGIRLITLDRPQARNALHTAMQRELDGVLGQLAADDDVRAVIITGAGEQAFCAGYDIRELQDFDEAGTLANYEARRPLVWNFAAFPKPFIGALRGSAHGAGAILATTLDIRVGSRQTDFRFTAAAYGGVNNTWQLPRIIGLPRALEYTMTARRIFGDEAFAAGLLNHRVEPGAELDKALELAAQIAAHPAQGVQWHKALMRQSLDRTLAEAYETENALMIEQYRPGRPDALFRDALKKNRPG